MRSLLLRSALFWDITQCRVVILYRCFGQCINPIFKGKEVQEDFLTVEDGTDMLSQNVGEGPLDAA
jgi:hypothetical protein